MKLIFLALAIFGSSLLPINAADPLLEFNTKGSLITITSDAGICTCPPLGLYTGEKKMVKYVSATLTGTTTTQTYEDGSAVKVTLVGGNEIDFDFSQVDASITNFVCVVRVDYELHLGGQWKAGEKQGIFPEEKSATAGIYGGKDSTIALTNAKGATLEITFPDLSYLHLTDNRFYHENDKTFALAASIDRTSGTNVYKLMLK